MDFDMLNRVYHQNLNASVDSARAEANSRIALEGIFSKLKAKLSNGLNYSKHKFKHSQLDQAMKLFDGAMIHHDAKQYKEAADAYFKCANLIQSAVNSLSNVPDSEIEKLINNYGGKSVFMRTFKNSVLDITSNENISCMSPAVWNAINKTEEYKVNFMLCMNATTFIARVGAYWNECCYKNGIDDPNGSTKEVQAYVRQHNNDIWPIKDRKDSDSLFRGSKPATEALFKGKSSPLTQVINLYNQANQKYDNAEGAKNDLMFRQARDIYNKADAAMKKVLSQIKGMSEDQFYKTMIDPFGKSEFRKNFPWAVRNSSGDSVVCMSDKFITVYNSNASISYAMDIARINNMAYKIHYYALELKYVFDPWLTSDQKDEAISKLDIMATGDLKFKMKDADDFK